MFLRSARTSKPLENSFRLLIIDQFGHIIFWYNHHFIFLECPVTLINLLFIQVLATKAALIAGSRDKTRFELCKHE